MKVSGLKELEELPDTWLARLTDGITLSAQRSATESSTVLIVVKRKVLATI